MITQTKHSALDFVLSDSYVYADEELEKLGTESHEDEVDLEPVIDQLALVAEKKFDIIIDNLHNSICPSFRWGGLQ